MNKKAKAYLLCGFACLLISGCAEEEKKEQKKEQKSEISVQLPNGKVKAQRISLECQTEHDYGATCTATIQIGKKYETTRGASYIEITGEGKTMAEAWEKAVYKLNCIQPNCIEKAGS